MRWGAFAGRRTRRFASLVATALLLCGCGGRSPATPSPVVASPPPDPTVMFTGRVTATNGQQPLANVKASFGPAITATTDSTGTFTMRFLPGTTSQLMLEGDTIVPRALVASVSRTRVLDVDAIQQGGGFDLKFYRQLVRDDLDSPGLLRPLRRWIQAPDVYLRTVDDVGSEIDPATLDLTEAAIRESVALWTGGLFGVRTLERGTDSREGVAGWITVKWSSSKEYRYCGFADVAVSGGMIELYAKTGCRCVGGPQIGPGVIRHEVGHAMGFFHTDSQTDSMWHQDVNCNQTPSARELYHARIAYARPIGNRDPDQDPTSMVHVAPMRIP